MGSIAEAHSDAIFEASAHPPASRTLGVVGAELMVRSRVTALAAPRGWMVQDVRTPAEALSVDLLLVDLNRDADLRLALLGRVRSTTPELPAVCFGAHLGAAGWAPAALRLGAVCCANSSLPKVLLGQLSRVPG